MKSSFDSSALLAATLVAARRNDSTANGCNDGFCPGTDAVIFTTAYTYAQIISVIDGYKNITWSDSSYDTVTLNITDNTVGTARTYDVAGAHVIETITTYAKPADGPHEEIHTIELLTIPATNVSFYADYDGTTVTPVCTGAAGTFNFTINFCATNAQELQRASFICST